MDLKLTERQKFVYDFLIQQTDFISPGIVGKAIFDKFKSGSGHSSTGSPICMKLVELGLVERNKKGYYKII